MEWMDQLESFCRDRDIPVRRDVALKEYCTFKIGGPADIFVEPVSQEQIAHLMGLFSLRDIPHMILGRGSNLLWADGGYRGAVVHLGRQFAQVTALSNHRVYSQSGAPLSRLCEFAWEQGLAGLEFAYGIPGTVGGAVYMNAGAYGGEMKDVVESATHLLPTGEMGSLSREEIGYGYRHSAYCDNGYVITGAVFALTPGDKGEIRARMDDFMNRRRTKQPLEYPSAGSTFKRPAGSYASALIDACGLKGRRVGDAQVSEKHAGFVINRGAATCGQVRELMDLVCREVEEKTGYRLEPEVKIVG